MPRIAFLCACLLAGCASVPTEVYRDTSAPISSAAIFDPARYQGRWYAIAHFPVPFEEGCFGTTADYALRPDGSLGVFNRCALGGFDGPEQAISGDGAPDGPGRFKIRFDGVPFARADYWVLWVDSGYRTAVVGQPSGKGGWILNRDPKIPEDRLNAALEVLDFNGYDITRIKGVPQQ